MKAEDVYGISVDKFSGFSGLHCESFFGIIDMKGCDINQIDFSGKTPLNWATWKEHEGVVKMLLERDYINPDKPNNEGQTPLWCAAANRHEGVVEILLGRDNANSDKPANDGYIPLLWAAVNGHQGVVIILLGPDNVNPNKTANYGGTLL